MFSWSSLIFLFLYVPFDFSLTSLCALFFFAVVFRPLARSSFSSSCSPFFFCFWTCLSSLIWLFLNFCLFRLILSRNFSLLSNILFLSCSSFSCRYFLSWGKEKLSWGIDSQEKQQCPSQLGGRTTMSIAAWKEGQSLKNKAIFGLEPTWCFSDFALTFDFFILQRPLLLDIPSGFRVCFFQLDFFWSFSCKKKVHVLRFVVFYLCLPIRRPFLERFVFFQLNSSHFVFFKDFVSIFFAKKFFFSVSSQNFFWSQKSEVWSTWTRGETKIAQGSWSDLARCRNWGDFVVHKSCCQSFWISGSNRFCSAWFDGHGSFTPMLFVARFSKASTRVNEATVAHCDLKCLSQQYLPFHLPITITLTPYDPNGMRLRKNAMQMLRSVAPPPDSPRLRLRRMCSNAMCNTCPSWPKRNLRKPSSRFCTANVVFSPLQCQLMPSTMTRRNFHRRVVTNVQHLLHKKGLNIVSLNIAELKEEPRDGQVGYLQARGTQEMANAVQNPSWMLRKQKWRAKLAKRHGRRRRDKQRPNSKQKQQNLKIPICNWLHKARWTGGSASRSAPPRNCKK